ncbi:MAG TPA: FAD-binding oxidoreductase [Candidatus Krumholzibacteria bacterium]|nr:FAD-binding oxidoreductase [Candidatus Krumholzibacteria bacterium]
MKRVLSTATLLGRREVASGTWILELAYDSSAPFRAGQFVMVQPRVEGCLLPRPFSILALEDGVLQILVKELGKGSRAMAQKAPGAQMEIFGPLGRAFPPELSSREALILVAGGVGIVPLRCLQLEFAPLGTRLVPLMGAHRARDLPHELLDGWELWVEEDPRSGMREGVVTHGLLEALERFPEATVACCGPTAMMKEVARISLDRETETWVCLEEQMACGAGVCRSCVIAAADGSRMRPVCKEGPVFPLNEIQYA